MKSAGVRNPTVPRGARTKVGEGVVVLIPVFNDWESLGLVVRQLDDVLAAQGFEAEVLVVDDGSTSSCPESTWSGDFQAIRALDVLALRCNLGHQRAIAMGLCYVDENRDYDAVLIMDGDGEDAPADALRLLRKYLGTAGNQIVFAERTRRSEGLVFRAGYAVFKGMHWLLTGNRIRVGNFSIVPRKAVHRLTAVSELWNHYAAAVYKSRAAFTTIPTQRASRLAGRSKMHFIALVVHGLSALSVYSEVIGVRVLMTAAALFGLACVYFGAVLAANLCAGDSLPGSTVNLLGQVSLLCLQLITLSLAFVFFILCGRSGARIFPARDYVQYLDNVRSVELGLAQLKLDDAPTVRRRLGAVP